ncbi:hypothetical protein C2845_PM04G06040 [Panicum miliaceum]|uniref:Late embryogenesis abundant protein LEA-2 subgroup domain-containing protein n=1 Tax=Panicum miliaceum TaxID=4540 RepID=A0A3L6QNP5_PANMI|nr:hypothetical protein C2845_PM04G06040 [Panicum miliaceum]
MCCLDDRCCCCCAGCYDSFCDRHPSGKTRVYHLAAGAVRFAALGNAGEAEFRKENATGLFEVEVALAGEVRYTAHFTKCKLAATCPLKLQLAPPGTPAVVFQKVKVQARQARQELLACEVRADLDWLIC